METQALRKLYEKVWDVPEYRNFSPGENAVKRWFFEAKPPKDTNLVFLGCGSGREALMAHRSGYNVWPIDFVSNSLDPVVRHEIGYRFFEADLTKPFREDFFEHVKSVNQFLGRKPDGFTDTWSPFYGFSCDVFEHLEEHTVDKAFENCMNVVDECIFQICLMKDHFGSDPRINHDLHLTVRPYEWWREKLKKWNLVDARDMNIYGWYRVRQYEVDSEKYEWEVSEYGAKEVSDSGKDEHAGLSG